MERVGFVQYFEGDAALGDAFLLFRLGSAADEGLAFTVLAAHNNALRRGRFISDLTGFTCVLLIN